MLPPLVVGPASETRRLCIELKRRARMELQVPVSCLSLNRFQIRGAKRG